MKLKESEFSTLLQNSMSGVPAVLIHGPDNGKNIEYAEKIIERLGIAPDNLITAGRDDLRERFDAIFSDACSASMFGGAKLAFISDPDGRDISLIQQLAGQSVSPVVITGDFDSKSALRKWFEDHEKAAALPLYADDEASLGGLIRGHLAKLGITAIDPDAMGYMFMHLGRDRLAARQFLDKIALFVDDKKTVSLDDVQKCLPDTGAANIDDFKYNLTAGNITPCLRAMDRLFAQNTNAAMLARVLGAHFKDLLNCVAGGIMPRVFWKYSDLFGAARKIWSESDLAGVLTRLSRLEADTRGPAAEIMLRDFSLKLAAKAYKISRTKR